MKKIVCMVLSLCCAAGVVAQSKTGVVAHRGYWKAEGAAQNSIASLKSAIAIGAEGSELDVYISTDDVVFLFHDATLHGKRMETYSSQELQAVKLSNGESIPTFESYLAVAKQQKKTKPIIEIKSHQNKDRENAVVDAVLAMVHKAKMDKRVEYISFSQNACERIIAKAPKAKVAYLSGDLTPQELADKGYTGLDYHIGTMRAHEDWFEQARQLGLEVNVWTVDQEEDMKWLLERHPRYITTDEPEMLQRLIREAR
ncbi:MAG: glycerophosphodiester phosphodiesterase family protein [Alistipes sp.]|nr:glycerophosphodiester phosphodiesterase family protein [Alistipes sp.]